MIFSSLQKHSNKMILVAVAGLFFLVGLGSGFAIKSGITLKDISVHRANDATLTFTNPLLSCDISENKEFSEYKQLSDMIDTIISNADVTKVGTVSVYYRELNSGRWFGREESELYSPASLLKVPVMIAYLKEAEKDTSALSKRIYYSGDNALTNSNEHFRSSQGIVPRHSYTVDELITSMIRYSDNAAADLLYKNMETNSLAEVMSDIGVRLPEDANTAGTTDFLTVKSYSYLFRLLYNSTYLSREMSEKALKLLSYAEFKEGVIGGLPTGTQTAEKFGERTVVDASGVLLSRELHDCGIVYYPKHPYLLCVMTKGTDFDALSSTIKQISALVYKNIDTRYTK